MKNRHIICFFICFILFYCPKGRATLHGRDDKTTLRSCFLLFYLQGPLTYKYPNKGVFEENMIVNSDWPCPVRNCSKISADALLRSLVPVAGQRAV